MEIDSIIFNEEPDEVTCKRIEKEFRRLCKANNITDKIYQSYSGLLLYGEAKIQIENIKEC